MGFSYLQNNTWSEITKISGTEDPDFPEWTPGQRRCGELSVQKIR